MVSIDQCYIVNTLTRKRVVSYCVVSHPEKQTQTEYKHIHPTSRVVRSLVTRKNIAHFLVHACFFHS